MEILHAAQAHARPATSAVAKLGNELGVTVREIVHTIAGRPIGDEIVRNASAAPSYMLNYAK